MKLSSFKFINLSSFRKPGYLPGFLFFCICLLLGFTLSRQGGSTNIYAKLCHFVDQHAYLADKEMRPWLQACLARASLVKSDTPADVIIKDLNAQFSFLKTSHLVLYNAEESQKIWSGENAETGIEAQYVEGELVIFRIHKNSPAESVGLRMGDVIYRINNLEASPEIAEKASGSFMIMRDKKLREYRFGAKKIMRDEEPILIRMSDKTAVFKVPSFRAEFFKKSHWQAQVQELKKYPKIIVDLRGNQGGNFIAGLRFLSSFMCSPQNIGYLFKPKSKLKTEMNLADDLDDENQIRVLDQNFLVNLWTFDEYDCLASSVSVLVDSFTASTAEMVAQAMRDYVGAKIFGTASSGQLLVGVWYPVPELGTGVKISVPEAVYQTRRGHKLEGPGVQIDKVLYYHLEEMQNGEDSWVKAAMRSF